MRCPSICAATGDPTWRPHAEVSLNNPAEIHPGPTTAHCSDGNICTLQSIRTVTGQYATQPSITNPSSAQTKRNPSVETEPHQEIKTE
jgi:hypothetical protein